MQKEVIFNNIIEGFNLKRIKELPFSEKFRLVEYAKLIYQEAQLAELQGILALENSENFTVDKTYNLFAMLIVKGTEDKYVKDIILNYGANFDDSDTYYAKIVFLGIGVMLINQKFSPDAIFNYLMVLLGDEFLRTNLKVSGLIAARENKNLKLDAVITYKSFDYTYRRVKYQLLGLLKYRLDHGLEQVGHIINEVYGNKELKLYFSLLKVDDAEARDILYNKLVKEVNEMNHLLLAGAYAITTGTRIYVAHYLFNSVIGKYSRYDKKMQEVDEEMAERLSEILKEA